ncbi:peptidoglycan-binding protein LysM [Robertkochia aurantiaca]|uniref:peptidoglycan-binding protein LysM n=1 Tax=Robertkochia aurantiaca TaxID=2873700 RepID=UPI001CCB654D|nr:peptidoglycan-binding protein LysM [Robertkochia sp. 3YJGBD-33]
MGLITFITDSGAKLFSTGNNEDAEQNKEKQSKSPENKKAAKRLKETIADLKLEVDDFEISIEGDTARVEGKTADHKTREKVVLVIGNHKGIAVVDDRLQVSGNSQPESNFYNVISGDSLSKIAKEYYGDAMKYNLIFEANKPMLKDPNKIYPGQVLRIPSED